MANHLTLGVLNGDDIGLEIVPAAVDVVKAAAARTGLKIDWRPMPLGRTALDTHGSTFPEGTIEALQKMDGFILGPIGHQAYPKVPGAINPHPILRKRFNLFANVRPTKSYPGLGAIYDDIDLVIVRENNEGFQPDRNVVAGSGEFRPTEDMTISVRVITRLGSSRVARAAFEIAQQRKKRLTVVHKNTVFKLGCGMFVEECYRVAKDFPDVTVERGHRRHHGDAPDPRPAEFRRHRHHQHVRRHPDRRGGRSGWRAGHGARPVHRRGRHRHGAGDAWLGTRHRRQGHRQSFRHDRVARMMIEWLGHNRKIAQAVDAARIMEAAIATALANPATRTNDIRGTGGTADMTRGILAAIGGPAPA